MGRSMTDLSVVSGTGAWNKRQGGRSVVAFAGVVSVCFFSTAVLADEDKKEVKKGGHIVFSDESKDEK